MFRTVAETCLIIALSASAGTIWNWSLLTRVWRGDLTQQAEASSSASASTPARTSTSTSASTSTSTAAPVGEALPMPIGLMQVKELHDAKEAVIVDARNTDSFAAGHIAGAIVLPLEEARKSPPFPPSAKVAKDAAIIVYCNGFSCHDSMEVGKLLIQAGYSSVYVFEGGYPEWKDAGYPVATGGI